MGPEPDDVMALLAPVYGLPVAMPSGDPLAELILTVLSQNTADTNSGRAFVQLMRRYPSWEAIARAPVEELAGVIQPGGLAAQKAPRIQAILRAVAAVSPSYDLGFLGDLPVSDARSWLRSCPVSARRRRRACCCSPWVARRCRSIRTWNELASASG